MIDFTILKLRTSIHQKAIKKVERQVTNWEKYEEGLTP